MSIQLIIGFNHTKYQGLRWFTKVTSPRWCIHKPNCVKTLPITILLLEVIDQFVFVRYKSIITSHNWIEIRNIVIRKSFVQIHNIRSNQDHPPNIGGLASHSRKRNHSMKIRHYKELGDLDLQWSEPLNLAVFESSVVAIFSMSCFLSYVKKCFLLSLPSLLIASDESPPSKRSKLPLMSRIGSQSKSLGFQAAPNNTGRVCTHGCPCVLSKMIIFRLSYRGINTGCVPTHGCPC